MNKIEFTSLMRHKQRIVEALEIIEMYKYTVLVADLQGELRGEFEDIERRTKAEAVVG
ncbi:MAG: hypothetical protein WCI77_07885 [Candidatus Omnitrophota bacterium]